MVDPNAPKEFTPGQEGSVCGFEVSDPSEIDDSTKVIVEFANGTDLEIPARYLKKT